MNRRPVIAVALLLLGSGCAPVDRGREGRGKQVDALFEDLDEGDRPGIALAVIENGATVYAAGYGLASLEDRAPITPHTVFDIASISKQFAGLSVAMLVQEGEISLDDDVHAYLPELADFGRTITIDHLVHHESGIRDWPGTLAVAGWSMEDVISFDQILDFAYHQRTLNFEPGSEYTYSNTGYNLLAETVRRVTGQSFRSWTDEHLFQPLGMTATHFHDDHREVIADRAWGYSPDGDDGWRRTPNNLTALGSSSLYTTVEDLAKWVANMETGQVGGDAQELWRTPGVLNDGSENPYAFGIVNDEYRGAHTLQHSGGWASFSTYLLYLPEHGFGVVVLANHPTNVGAHARAIVDIWLGDALGAAADSETAGVAPIDVQVSRETMMEYQGTYRLGPGWYVEIVLGPDGLTTQATREDAFPMTPRSEEEFWVEAYGSTITFLRNARGEVDGIEYRGERRPRMMQHEETNAEELAQLAGTYESVELRTGYDVAVDGEELVLTHPRHGAIRLERAWGGEFTGSAWFMQAVEFRRAPDGTGTAMVVYAGERNRDILFARRR
jgi:CubicO group peptidase (beta-lactamase class C family)